MIKIYISSLKDFKDPTINKRTIEHRSGLELLKYALRKENLDTDNLEYIYQNGKPYLNNNIYFNISHSHQKVVVAICDSEVGIDLEQIKNQSLLLKKRIFNGQEQIEGLDKLSYDEQFTKVWTIKEAFVKYLGIGITKGFNQIMIENDIVRNDICQAYYESIRLEDYYLTVVNSQKKEIQIQSVSL